jgi:capsular exopolysaccharide synthesis family protein
VDVRTVLGLLRRRWRAIAICLVAGLLGASVVTARTEKQYQSSARLFVNIPRAGSVAEQVQGVQLSVQLLQSYARIATSRTSAQRIAERLGGDSAFALVDGHIGATPQPETLLIDVAAEAGDPQTASRIANAAADVLIDTIDQLERNKATRVTAQVIDPAVPAGSPFAPRPKVNLALGGLLGLIVGLLLALALDALDRSVKTAAQAVESFRTVLLAVTPRSREVKDRPVPEDSLSPVSEAFRTLRTAVRFIDPDRPLRTILVTSPVAREGKTTTAVNLAAALAQSGERVVLVDADLRRARLGATLGLESNVGLTGVVTRRVALDEALQQWRGMTVLAAGELPPNPSEVLGSEAMARVIEALRDRADVVVFDVPPVLPVTDAVVLSTQVDGVVLIARYGQTQKAQAAEARRRLEAVGARVVGCVLNAAPAVGPQGYYEEYAERRPQAAQWGRRWTDRVSR